MGLNTLPATTRAIRGQKLPSRRGFFKIAAAAAVVPALAAGVRGLAPRGKLYDWQLEVMGAVSELALWHEDPAVAGRTIDQVRSEVARLDGIFSLYRGDSEISRLNRDGFLDNPSWELRDQLSAGRRFSELSGGAFDISVQPLWALYAAHFWSGAGPAQSETSADIDAAARGVAERLVDYRLIDIGPRRIEFGRPGMGVTLNSIGQGFVADRIADMLSEQGFTHVYADLGETRLIGGHPDGRPWRIGLSDPKAPAHFGRTLELENIGLAVSGGYGTPFEETGRYNHIFDPRTGLSAAKMTAIAVTAPSAMIANGLATSIYVAGREHAAKILAAYPGARAVVTTANGEWLGSGADGSFAALPAEGA
jgi:thiamine biosynthesis lipoprotein